jgi:hypothetical protein
MQQSRQRLIALCALLASADAGAGGVDVIYADQFESNCGQIVYVESFAQSNGAPWPTPWTVIGGTALADVQTGRARLRPFDSGYSLARMFAPVSTRDVEVRFRFLLEHEPTQGVGFYVRQNGGYLTQTNPTGAGYAIFIEGNFRGLPGLGVWREQNGNEIQIAHSVGVAGPAQNVLYRARLQVLQSNATTTTLQAKFWPDAQAEPAAWQVSANDSTPSLQNLSGGIAVDSWSVLQSPSVITAHTFVDDIEIETLCAASTAEATSAD